MKRRDFVKNISAIAGIGFIPCGLAAAQGQQHGQESHQRREVVVNGKRMLTVDIHCHSYVHDVWPLISDSEEIGYLRPLLGSPVREKIDLPNVDFRLAQMDQQGIDIQAVSLHVGQYHYWADYDLARQIVTIQNEKIAELCAAHPDRFVGLGAVALQHPDLAVQQMKYAIKNLNMRGFMITGSVNDVELSDPRFDPFWAAAEELGTVIFIHPRNFPAGQSRLEGNGRLDNVIGNPLETTIALSHLIFEGTLDRYPGLKICAAHGGGYLPSYAGRSDHCVEFAAKFCKAVGKLPSAYLKEQLYFDSLVYTTDILEHMIKLVGADRIVLGTDFPFEMGNAEAVDHVLSVPGLSDAERELILGSTAAGLLGINQAG
jgi:predicted TIM-barrel fold metal-dependent hydrolase